MEAYNFFAGASITTVHAEKEREGTLVKSAKTIAKSVLSIATKLRLVQRRRKTRKRGWTMLPL
jgi:hypothetical protein